MLPPALAGPASPALAREMGLAAGLLPATSALRGPPSGKPRPPAARLRSLAEDRRGRSRSYH
jgi:hypothetical protein